MPLLPAHQALDRLRDGNRRFAANVRAAEPFMTELSHEELLAPQQPCAIVVGCSDSRVPAELVFGQGLGSLFVIRVAGQVIAPSQMGSVEFAAERFGTRLVVVMGHAQCGAVEATLDALLGSPLEVSRNILSIVERIRPAVEPLVHTELAADRAALSRAAVRANVRAAANQLRHGTEILEGLAASSGLLVVGAEFNLQTGVVDFFDGVP
jgi:carbonic anhydrase